MLYGYIICHLIKYMCSQSVCNEPFILLELFSNYKTERPADTVSVYSVGLVELNSSVP